MDREARQRALEEIRKNIARFGYHLYIVSGKQDPRYAYTIGLSPRLGHELIFAGGILFMYKEVGAIIRGIVEQLKDATSVSERQPCQVAPFGSFSFRPCDPSWVSLLMLGATDFYQREDIAALQIVPDDEHITIDVPDMAIPWSAETAPIWRWLKEPWTYSVPSDSEAVTDLDALRGFAVTEACRWEENYWELFATASPEVPKEDMRVVGLGMLLAADSSLTPILELKVGDGIWREDDLEWHVWQSPKSSGEPPA
jgi:hypothetical protein